MAAGGFLRLMSCRTGPLRAGRPLRGVYTGLGTQETCPQDMRLWHGDEGGHGFDAVPEVLQAEVFVGGVLVVVVVGDGDGDGAGVGGALHGVG